MGTWSFFKELRSIRETAEGARESEYKNGFLAALRDVYEIAEDELELEDYNPDA